MEKRVAKVGISSAGGTAGKGAKTYKLTIPSTWITALNITEEDRDVELTFDRERIMITRPMEMEQFVQQSLRKSHVLKAFLFFDGENLCTKILADFTDKTVCVENKTEQLVKTAFGKNTLPLWDDFMAFLEERCVPRAREGLNHYLEVLDLDEYDPLEIIRRTQGRMAEDNQWIEVQDL